ncbi:MAG: BolA family transcriptional regulator [Proteobacteria bacterium]|nr:BolA family transcriptional regulator [Pseudomonadota bacterium]MBS0574304.1 BolA family transcriptional regulator [Pseudomonadota bacterium]
MSIAAEMERALAGRFAPTLLRVIDESEAHRGHAGWREGGETHFRVVIRAAAFGPMSRLDRQRAVLAALGPDLTGRVHALALDVAGD